MEKTHYSISGEAVYTHRNRTLTYATETKLRANLVKRGVDERDIAAIVNYCRRAGAGSLAAAKQAAEDWLSDHAA